VSFVSPPQGHGYDNRDGKITSRARPQLQYGAVQLVARLIQTVVVMGLADDMSVVRDAWVAVLRLFAMRVRVHPVKAASMRSGATKGPAVRRE